MEVPMSEPRADPGRHQWLALGEESLPHGEHWLAPGEAAVLSGLRYTKRRTEFLLRRLVTKQAVASVIGEATDPGELARIEVRNAPSGAPFVCVDGNPVEMGVSISDRAGWAVCVTCPTESASVGCDLELVEPRTPAFLADFLTPAEQQWVASHPDRDTAANLLWSAKESALKVLQTGLRRDTRSVEVTVDEPRGDGWGALTVRAVEGSVFPGWWRRDGRFLLTTASAVEHSPPAPLGDTGVLALAEPRHSWLDRPLHR